jgi:hypothetical protein
MIVEGIRGMRDVYKILVVELEENLRLWRLSLTSKAVLGARDSIVAKALSYKPEGRWFDTR